MTTSMIRAGTTRAGLFARDLAMFIAVPGVALSMVVLAGCGGVSELTKERVERSATVVEQAEQTIGNSEQGALELQRAREQLEQAQRAVDDNKAEEAERHAQKATLTAEFAVAKSQSASAREAADELQASIRTLRREAGLTDPDAGSEDESGIQR